MVPGAARLSGADAGAGQTRALAKVRAILAERRPDLVLPEAAWRKPWVVHCTAWDEGPDAVLAYLARLTSTAWR